MISETMRKTNIIIKGMKVIDMSAGSTTEVEDIEVKVDSLESQQSTMSAHPIFYVL